MSYTIYIKTKDNDGNVSSEDVTSFVNIGFGFVEKLDESLDNGTFVLSPTERKKPYNLFDTLIVELDGTEIISQRVFSDSVERVSKSDDLFRHTIGTVEHTKVLEQFSISGFTLTQPLDGATKTLYDAVESLRNTYPLEERSILSSTRLFEIDSAEITYLNGFLSPEVTLKDITLRDAYNKLLDEANATVRLVRDTNGDLKFKLDLYNELNNLITDETGLINETRNHDGTYYATSMVSDAINMVSDSNTSDSVATFPSESQFITPRSNDYFINDENITINMPKPIYEIRELSWKGEITTTGSYTFSGEITLDLTYRVREREAYQILPVDKQQGAVPTVLYDQRKDPNNYFQSTTIAYDYKGTTIDLVTSTGVWDSSSSLDFVIGLAMQKYLFDNGLAGENDWLFTNLTISIDTAFDDYLFRVKYKPILSNLRFDMDREDVSDVNKTSNLLSNQQSRIVNLSRFSDNVYGKINRIGNVDLELSERVVDLNDTYSIGDYTSDMFIVTVKETVFFTDYIRVNYSLTKNFNKIAQMIGVNSENRQWEIGESGRTLERDILYKEYIEVDVLTFGSGSNNSLLLTQDGREKYFDTFATRTVGDPIRVGSCIPRSATNGLLLDPIRYYDTSYLPVGYLLPSEITGESKSLFFSFKINSNKVLATYANDVDDTVTGAPAPAEQIANDFIAYTDDDGTIESIIFKYYEDLPSLSLANEITQGKILPALRVTTTELLDYELYIDKDNRSVLGGTVQFQHVSSDLEKVIIGKALSTKNRLVYDGGISSFKLYTYTTHKFTQRDTNLANTDGTIGIDYEVLLTTPSISTLNNRVVISSAILDSSKSSWCLTDDEDRILIAVNQDGTQLDTIIFDFNNKRSGINYKY